MKKVWAVFCNGERYDDFEGRKNEARSHLAEIMNDYEGKGFFELKSVYPKPDVEIERIKVSREVYEYAVDKAVDRSIYLPLPIRSVLAGIALFAEVED